MTSGSWTQPGRRVSPSTHPPDRNWPQRDQASPASAGCQPGNGAGYPAELADLRELAALAHGPAEQLLRVGVDRVQVAAITGDRLVADALLARPGRGRYRR